MSYSRILCLFHFAASVIHLPAATSYLGVASSACERQCLRKRNQARHERLCLAPVTMACHVLCASTYERDRFRFRRGENRLIPKNFRKFALVATLCIFSAACGNKSGSSNEPAPAGQPTATSTPGTAGESSSASKTAVAPSPTLKTRSSAESGPVTIPENTVITVRTAQQLGSKISQD